jgi:hypothetical protein
MPLFYLHAHNSTGFVEDEEGQDLPDLAAARAAAVDGIRSILAGEVRAGSLDTRGRIDIADDTGRVLATVRFREAVELRLDEEAA